LPCPSHDLIANTVLDPLVHKLPTQKVVSSNFATPVTTSASFLSVDKRTCCSDVWNSIPVSNDEMDKSVHILQSFWGNLLALDQTKEKQAGKKTKIKPTGSCNHANKLSGKGVQSTSSEHMQTPSKKGVIKSNPKYL